MGSPSSEGGWQEKECPREIRPLWSPGKPGEDSRAGKPVRSKSDSWTGPHPHFRAQRGKGLEHVPAPGQGLFSSLECGLT